MKCVNGPTNFLTDRIKSGHDDVLKVMTSLIDWRVYLSDYFLHKLLGYFVNYVMLWFERNS